MSLLKHPYKDISELELPSTDGFNWLCVAKKQFAGGSYVMWVLELELPQDI